MPGRDMLMSRTFEGLFPARAARALSRQPCLCSDVNVRLVLSSMTSLLLIHGQNVTKGWGVCADVSTLGHGAPERIDLSLARLLMMRERRDSPRGRLAGTTERGSKEAADDNEHSAEDAESTQAACAVVHGVWRRPERHSRRPRRRSGRT